MHRTSTVSSIRFLIEFDLLSFLHFFEVGWLSKRFEIKEQLTRVAVRLNPAPSRTEGGDDFGYTACHHRPAPSACSDRPCVLHRPSVALPMRLGKLALRI